MKIKNNTRLLISICLLIIAAANLFSLMTIFRNSVLIFLIKHLLGISSIRFNFLQLIAIVIYSFYSIIFLFILKEKNKNELIKLFYLMMIFLSAAIIVSSMLYGFLENINYPNYVFGKYGIFLPSLQIYANFQLLIIGSWVAYLIVTNKRIYTLFRFKRILELLILISLILITFHTVEQFPAIALNSIRSYKFYSSEKGDDKIENDVKVLKIKLNFVIRNTTENATIIHPPQSAEFPDIGNQVFIRYFLFPRTLVTDSLVSDYLSQAKLQDTNIYSIIAVGQQNGEPIIYPNYEIKSDYILIKYKNNPAIKIEEKLYTPSLITNPTNFEIGLIKYAK